MRTTFMGVTAGLLLGTAGVGTALAQGTAPKPSSTQQQQKHEASETKAQERAEAGQAHHATQEHHVVGRITSIKGDTLYVQAHERVVPLKVGKDTHFDGVKKAGSAQQTLNNDFREGQAVRASYRVEGSTNMARTLAPEKSPSKASSTKAEKPSTAK